MIDLTLNDILIPDIIGYENPYHFGHKIERTQTNQGGLSSREVNNNILMPFLKMRTNDNVVTTDETTSEVEYDAKIVIKATDSITLSLNNAKYEGCRIIISNFTNYDHTLVCSSLGQRDKLIIKKSETELMWNGSAWINFTAPAVGKRVVQFPQEKEPELIFPCTTWEEVSYNGAFFRSYKENISDPFIDYISDDAILGSPQSQATNNGNLEFVGKNDQYLNSKAPNWSGSYTYTHYHPQVYINAKGGSTSKSDTTNIKSGDRANLVTRTADERSYASNKYLAVACTLSGNHKHYFTPSGSISTTDTGNETRPANYTIKIWKRTS